MKVLFYMFLPLSLIVCSCSNDMDTISEASSLIDLETSIYQPVTRSNGTSFTKGDSIGIFICRTAAGGYTAPTQASEFVAYAQGDINLCARNTGSGWVYRMEDKGSTFSYLYITNDKVDPHNADFYAYSPYVAGVRDLNAISFDLISTTADKRQYQNDIMWAMENCNTTTNKNITPDNTPKQIKFHFHHALAKIIFRFRVQKYKLSDDLCDSTQVEVSSIRLIKKQDALPLFTKATLNAMKNSDNFTLSNPVDTMTVTYYNSATKEYVLIESYRNFPFLVAPVDASGITNADDVVYLAEIFLNGTEKLQFPITKKMITHSDNATVGFKAGYSYTFSFLIDNYLHLDNITIDQNWYDGGQTEEQI